MKRSCPCCYTANVAVWLQLGTSTDRPSFVHSQTPRGQPTKAIQCKAVCKLPKLRRFGRCTVLTVPEARVALSKLAHGDILWTWSNKGRDDVYIAYVDVASLCTTLYVCSLARLLACLAIHPSFQSGATPDRGWG